jgi:hypothetical protein
MKRLTLLLTLALSLLVPGRAAAQTTLPTTRPAQVAVFLQPKRNLQTWAARGVTLAIGRDREANADGSDGVSLAEWKAAAKAAGLRYVVDPSGDPAADARDPNLAGFLSPIDEPDGAVITAQDLNAGDAVASAAAQEAVYATEEAFYANCKRLAPNVAVYISFDLNQFQYHRPNYTRLFKACDRFTVDYYPVQRAMPVGEYGRLIDLVRVWPGGDKLALAWIETSYQHLDPAYFRGNRAPTVAEWLAETQQMLDRKLWVGWFPQCINADRLAAFSTDATTPEIAAAMVAWLKAPGAGGVDAAHGGSGDPPRDPLAGWKIVSPSGVTYTLTRTN